MVKISLREEKNATGRKDTVTCWRGKGLCLVGGASEKCSDRKVVFEIQPERERHLPAREEQSSCAGCSANRVWGDQRLHQKDTLKLLWEAHCRRARDLTIGLWVTGSQWMFSYKLYFEIISVFKEVAKIVHRSPLYSSPQFYSC